MLEEIDQTIKEYDHLSNNKKYNKLLIYYDKTTVDFYMYDTYKYIHQLIDDEDDITEQSNRNGQTLFREQLINRYKTCIISGCSPDVCDAAHIIPYAELNSEHYNIDNGILLRKDLHALFDNKKLIINPHTLIVRFNENIIKDNKDYIQFNNKKIILNTNSIKYLEIYYE
jgi:hypothetical protein